MTVFLTDEQTVPVDVDALHALARRVLDAERCPSGTEVTVMLVTEDVIAGYNERFLDRSGPTDVLAFPLEELEPGVPPVASPSGPPPMLGDVIIAPSYVARQADAYGVTVGDELALMLVHGMLHLMGYDHDDDADAERMEGRESEILATVGVRRR